MGLTIEPKGNRMYILLDEFQEQVGQIYMPQKHSEQDRFATVIACGDEVTMYEEGDRILVSYYAGNRIHLIKYNITDDRHRIISEEEVKAKVTEE